MNPSEGRIQAEEIETLILDPEKIDPAETEIICPAMGCNRKRTAYVGG